MYSCSRFSGLPGAMGCVGYLRCRICMPVFSSVQITTRPCSKKRWALRYKEHRSCALASKSGSWLLSQYTLRWGCRSASSRMRQILERLMGPVRLCTRAATKSSRLQRVAAQWYVAGLRVAIDITSRRSEGGKAPRPTGARRIVQATEAVVKITLAPTANSMAITVELGGHLEIRRALRRRGP